MPVAMRASGVWGAAEPLLLSGSPEGAESQPNQAPWGILGEAPGLGVSKKLTHLEAVGKESSVSPGRPWLGMLLVTQCCGMGSVTPASRDSLQQNPSDDRLRESCCPEDVESGRRSNRRLSCPGPGTFSHFPAPGPPSARLKASCSSLRLQAGQMDIVVAPKREHRSLRSCRALCSLF